MYVIELALNWLQSLFLQKNFCLNHQNIAEHMNNIFIASISLEKHDKQR